jgi:hypothetical protein
MHSSKPPDLFREYLQAMREFLEVRRKCIIRGWPDRKEAIEVQSRLAYLNCDVQAWRLDYLWTHELLEPTVCRSLASIFERLNKEWSAGEETTLKETDELYRATVANSDVARSRLDPPALEGPSEDLERDRDYLQALDVLRRKAHSLDEQLQRLVSGKPP